VCVCVGGGGEEAVVAFFKVLKETTKITSLLIENLILLSQE
jgi:hypothetical protein